MSFILPGIARLAAEGSGHEESNTVMALLGSLLTAIPAFLFWQILFSLFSWGGAETTWSLLIVGSALGAALASILTAYLLVAGFIGGGGLLSRGAFTWLLCLSLVMAALAICSSCILLIYRILITDIALDLGAYLSHFSDILTAYPDLQTIVLIGGGTSAFVTLFGYGFFYIQLWSQYLALPTNRFCQNHPRTAKGSASIHSNKA